MSNEMPMKKQSFLGGAAVLALATAVVKLIGMFFKIPLQMVIHEAGYGYFTTAYDIYSVLLMISTTGLPVAFAANQVVASGGGIVVADGGRITGQVVLEIAGLMSEGSLPQVNARLEQAKAAAFRQGVNTGIDPFMTLSFMSLPVIPQLRLTTRGVIDVATQQYL